MAEDDGGGAGDDSTCAAEAEDEAALTGADDSAFAEASGVAELLAAITLVTTDEGWGAEEDTAKACVEGTLETGSELTCRPLEMGVELRGTGFTEVRAGETSLDAAPFVRERKLEGAVSGREECTTGTVVTERTVDADMSPVELKKTTKLGAAALAPGRRDGMISEVEETASVLAIEDRGALDGRAAWETGAAEEPRTLEGVTDSAGTELARETLEAATAVLDGTDTTEGAEETARLALAAACDSSLIVADGRAAPDPVSVTAGAAAARGMICTPQGHAGAFRGLGTRSL